MRLLHRRATPARDIVPGYIGNNQDLVMLRPV
jgi:hypothetical protein